MAVGNITRRPSRRIDLPLQPIAQGASGRKSLRDFCGGACPEIAPGSLSFRGGVGPVRVRPDSYIEVFPTWCTDSVNATAQVP